MKESWKTWNIGNTIRYTADEFDGYSEFVGVVTEKENDHLIVEADGMKLWCEEFNQNMFRKVR